MPTSLDLEREKQRRWRLRPVYANVKRFDRFIDNEFMSAAQWSERQNRQLATLARFAARQVPYYQQLFQRLGLGDEDIRQAADLQRLPHLTRRMVQEHEKALRAPRLPKGHGRIQPARTSGTTGQPVSIWHTEHSLLFFVLTKQREFRWANFDPLAVNACFAPPKDLPPQPDGAPTAKGLTCRLSAWPLVGEYFHTGPYLGFDSGNATPDHIAWLESHRPDYLMAMSSSLEQLALGYQDRPRPKFLRGVHAVAQQLTPAMRRTIGSILDVPILHTYALNEIGMVASQCPEGGRFHVHGEHCLVEIVDDQGRPAPPGQFGRLLITSLTNYGMPLLRYDVDDLAMVVEGPCRCGRTLPSFGEIQGRYRRMAFLPTGVWNHWIAIQRTLNEMPLALMGTLRQYQAHHRQDGSFLLRLACTGPLAPEFHDRLRAAWSQANQEVVFTLEVNELKEIPKPPGIKFQNFTSDLIPPPDWDPGVNSPDRRPPP